MSRALLEPEVCATCVPSIVTVIVDPLEREDDIVGLTIIDRRGGLERAESVDPAVEIAVGADVQGRHGVGRARAQRIVLVAEDHAIAGRAEGDVHGEGGGGRDQARGEGDRVGAVEDEVLSGDDLLSRPELIVQTLFTLAPVVAPAQRDPRQGDRRPRRVGDRQADDVRPGDRAAVGEVVAALVVRHDRIDDRQRAAGLVVDAGAGGRRGRAFPIRWRSSSPRWSS